MEHRARKFIDLAENLIDTYQDALSHAMENKNFVSDNEMRRIYDVIKAFMPKAAPAFENICINCPSYIYGNRLQGSIGRSAGIDMSSAADDVIDFIITLSRQSDPVKSRVFLMSIADFSNLYCRLTVSGRHNADDRIRKGLKHMIHGGDRMIYVGSGVFLFFFEKTNGEDIIPKKQAILESVFGLVGEKREVRSPRGSASGGAADDGPSLVDVAFQTDFDIEKHMKRAIATLADTHPRSPDGAASAVNHPGFETIANQLTFHFAPVWDARTSSVSLYQLETLREIEPGVFLHESDVLTRRQNDEFHYRLQLYKINHGFSTILSQEAQQGSIGLTPKLMIPLSFENFTGISADQFESDIHDIFGFHSGDQLILMLTDISEQMPRNLLIKIITSLKKRKVSVFCRIPFCHCYFNLLSNIEGLAAYLDVRDVLKFGFEIDIVEHVIQEFAHYAKSRHVLPMIAHVDSSTISGIAYKSGYAYIAGKVVGETRASMNPITSLPASRILLKS